MFVEEESEEMKTDVKKAPVKKVPVKKAPVKKAPVKRQRKKDPEAEKTEKPVKVAKKEAPAAKPKAARVTKVAGDRLLLLSYIISDKKKEAEQWMRMYDLKKTPGYEDLHYLAYLHDRPWALKLVLKNGISKTSVVPGHTNSIETIVNYSGNPEMRNAMQTA